MKKIYPAFLLLLLSACGSAIGEMPKLDASLGKTSSEAIALVNKTKSFWDCSPKKDSSVTNFYIFKNDQTGSLKDNCTSVIGASGHIETWKCRDTTFNWANTSSGAALELSDGRKISISNISVFDYKDIDPTQILYRQAEFAADGNSTFCTEPESDSWFKIE